MTHGHDSRPGPRLAGSNARDGQRPPARDLPVVEGGGIPDLEDEGGLTEGEAAAMLAGFGDESDGVDGHRHAPSGDAGIPMADDVPVSGSAATSASLDAIPMADISPAPAHPAHSGDASTIPPHETGTAEAGRFRAIGIKAKRHEDEWSRTPNVTGTGAIHVRTFMSKLTEDGFHALDARVNEWLDAHPQYEVKFVNTSIGTVTGKIKEPHLICQVWV